MCVSFSPHIAAQVRDLEQAVEHYREVFGMEVLERRDGEVVMTCGPVTFHFEDSEAGGTFLEFAKRSMKGAHVALRQGFR